MLVCRHVFKKSSAAEASRSVYMRERVSMFNFRKLTKEEKEERLAEMMDNAKWREDQRTKNVKHYKAQDKKEEENQAKNYESTGSSDFVM